jgi:hypothetical protein
VTENELTTKIWNAISTSKYSTEIALGKIGTCNERVVRHVVTAFRREGYSVYWLRKGTEELLEVIGTKDLWRL